MKQTKNKQTKNKLTIYFMAFGALWSNVSKFWKSDSLSPFVIWSLDENPSDGQVEETGETQAFIMVPPA